MIEQNIINIKVFHCKYCQKEFKYVPDRNRHEKDKCEVYGGEVDKRKRKLFDQAKDVSFQLDGSEKHTSTIFHDLLMLPEAQRNNVTIDIVENKIVVLPIVPVLPIAAVQTPVIDTVETVAEAPLEINYNEVNQPRNDILYIDTVENIDKVAVTEKNLEAITTVIKSGNASFYATTSTANELNENLFTSGNETLDKGSIAIATSPNSAKTSTKPLKKDSKSPNQTKVNNKQPFIEYYIYVRWFDEIIERQQQSSNSISKTAKTRDKEKIRNEKEPEDKGKSKTIVMSKKIVKFGIAQVLKDRSDGYGEDKGSFKYSICVPNREIAVMIESIFRARFKGICVNNTFEYVFVKDLRNLPNWNNEESEESNYETDVRMLYTTLLGELHRIFPQTRTTFGTEYITTLVSNIKGKLTNSFELTTLTTISKTLSLEDLPEYGFLFPDLINVIIKSSNSIPSTTKNKTQS